MSVCDCNVSKEMEKREQHSRLPWSERVNAISVNPHMASIHDIWKMAGELSEFQENKEKEEK